MMWEEVFPSPLTDPGKYGPDCGKGKCCPKRKLIEKNYSYCKKMVQRAYDRRNSLSPWIGLVDTIRTGDPHSPGIGDGLDNMADHMYTSGMAWCDATEKAHLKCKEGPTYIGIIPPWPSPLENNTDEWFCD